MNKQGGSYILATLIIMLAVIIALMYSPRFVDEPPSSGRTELLKSVLRGILRSEVANRTKTAFDYFEKYWKYTSETDLESTEKSLRTNNFLGDEKLGGILMKSIYGMGINNFREDSEKIEYRGMEGSTIQGRNVVNLTYFNLTLEYDLTDPALGKLEGSKSYYISLDKISVSKLTPVSGTVLYRIDFSFILEDIDGPVELIKYLVYALNNTQLEEVAYGVLESNNGHYSLSVLIRPEYGIMLREKASPYDEFGLLLVVSESRGETLWAVIKVKKD
jgi:hypothetical protein